MADSMKYPTNAIDSFQHGVVMDLRVRLAIDFLKVVPGFGAHKALDLADDLLEDAERRGWLAPLDHDPKLTDAVKNQAKRLGAFQMYQQLGANQAAQDEQSRVVPAAPQINQSKH